jgi:hypothetical protein
MCRHVIAKVTPAATKRRLKPTLLRRNQSK